MWPVGMWPGYIETTTTPSVTAGVTSRIDGAMTSATYTRAYRHVYDVCMTGYDVSLIKGSVVDQMGTSTTDSEINLHAFPVRFSPYDREVTQKIAWAENTDILCYISKKEIDLAGYTLLQLKKKYTKLRHASKTYDIKYIEYYSEFYNNFLYVIVGGVK